MKDIDIHFLSRHMLLLFITIISLVRTPCLSSQIQGVVVEANGILFSAMTSAERDAIANPDEGLVIYNTDSKCKEMFQGSGWYNMCTREIIVSEPMSEPMNILFGGSMNEFVRDAAVISDGGFIAVGDTRSSQSGDVSQANNGLRDFWIIRTDQNGNLLWEKNMGGSSDEIAYAVIECQDGNFLIGGYSASQVISGDIDEGSNGNNDAWLVKLDPDGDVIWKQLFGGIGSDIISNIVELPDGHIVVAGDSNSSADTNTDIKTVSTNGNLDYWVSKLDNNGNIIWTNMYGGSGFDFLRDIEMTSDGSFILVGSGTSSDGDISGTNAGSHDTWIVKISESGDIIWEKLYGGSGFEATWAISVADLDTLIVASYTDSSDGDVTAPTLGGRDYWVKKLDPNGNMMWNKRYGSAGEDSTSDMVKTNDGNFVITGRSNSFFPWKANIGETDTYTIKIDDTGAIIWSSLIGGSQYDDGEVVLKTSDGGVVIGATTNSSVSGDITSSNNGSNDIWLVKLGLNGNIQ